MAESVFGRSDALVGCAATAAALLMALAMFPAEPSPRGALFVPAVILSTGILLVPLARGIRRSPALLNAENLVAFGFVFWLLLDLIQGAYDLSDAADWAIRDAFIAIGISAAMMWLGVAGKPWPLPSWIKEIAQRPMDTQTVGRWWAGVLSARHVQLGSPPLQSREMFSYRGEQRWAAGGRAQLGGGRRFRSVQYAGTCARPDRAVISRRDSSRRLGAIRVVRGAGVLAQGGGRRIIASRRGRDYRWIRRAHHQLRRIVLRAPRPSGTRGHAVSG